MIASIARQPLGTTLSFPFFKELTVDLGWFFLVFGMLIIVGAGNAVNLTDGLDGLGIGPVMTTALTFRCLRVSLRQRDPRRLPTDHLRGRYRRTRGAVRGAARRGPRGFSGSMRRRLSIFMGDTGSLALGGLLGTVAVATKHEIALAIVGGLFVLEGGIGDRAGGVIPAVRQTRGSAWRRSIIISSKRAGPNRRS